MKFVENSRKGRIFFGTYNKKYPCFGFCSKTGAKIVKKFRKAPFRNSNTNLTRYIQVNVLLTGKRKPQPAEKKTKTTEPTRHAKAQGFTHGPACLRGALLDERGEQGAVESESEK
jgi:hypothetical protein